jgi:hypothetical protein
MNYFSGINDPRVERNKLYPLHEVIVITILAVIGMAEGWEDIERYGKAKKGWPGRFLKLEHGIPGHDVYRRVMYRIKPEEIENSLHYVLDAAFGEDGSRLRKDKGPENMAIMRKLALTVTMSISLRFSVIYML